MPTLTIAFIAQRYLADFVPVLVVGAAVGVPVVAAWVADSVARRRAVVTVTAVLLVIGLTVNVGLAVLARYVYILPTEAERRDFVQPPSTRSRIASVAVGRPMSSRSTPSGRLRAGRHGGDRRRLRRAVPQRR